MRNLEIRQGIANPEVEETGEFLVKRVVCPYSIGIVIHSSGGKNIVDVPEVCPPDGGRNQGAHVMGEPQVHTLVANVIEPVHLIVIPVVAVGKGGHGFLPQGEVTGPEIVLPVLRLSAGNHTGFQDQGIGPGIPGVTGVNGGAQARGNLITKIPMRAVFITVQARVPGVNEPVTKAIKAKAAALRFPCGFYPRKKGGDKIVLRVPLPEKNIGVIFFF